MKSLMLSAAFVTMFSGVAFAGGLDSAAADTAVTYVPGPIVGGSIEVAIAENEAGDYAATTTFGASIAALGLAFGEIGVESVGGNTFEVNKWYIGTTIGQNASVSFGDHDGGVFIEPYSDFSAIADPAINEALIVGVGSASVAVGFTDIKSDVTDVSNVQAAYVFDLGLAVTTAAADYNFDTEDYVLGLRSEGIEVVGVALGSTVSYQSANEVIAYEMDATVIDALTVYVNGDSDDALRNVGAGYERVMGSLTFNADVNYNVDAEEFAPSAGVTFSF